MKICVCFQTQIYSNKQSTVGKWKMLKWRNRSTETKLTEVSKQKYGNYSTEVKREAAYRCLVPLLTHKCVC